MRRKIRAQPGHDGVFGRPVEKLVLQGEERRRLHGIEDGKFKGSVRI